MWPWTTKLVIRVSFFKFRFMKQLAEIQLFQLEKTLRASEKDVGGGILKSAQDFFENMVYFIGL